MLEKEAEMAGWADAYPAFSLRSCLKQDEIRSMLPIRILLRHPEVRALARLEG
jgi:hypothetical protein